MLISRPSKNQKKKNETRMGKYLAFAKQILPMLFFYVILVLQSFKSSQTLMFQTLCLDQVFYLSTRRET